MMRRQPFHLGQTIRAGFGFVYTYLGLTVLTAMAGMFFSGFIGFGVSRIFAMEFARSSLFDEAITGDLGALALLSKSLSQMWGAPLWMILTLVTFYMTLSWCLVAGVMVVALKRPKGRAKVAECFGTAAMVGGWRFFRLSFATIIPWAAVAMLFAWGATSASESLGGVYSWAVALSKSILYLIPALFLGLYVSTVTGYARAFLMRQNSGVLYAFSKAAHFVVTHPLTLVHASIAPLAWISVGMLYALCMVKAGDVSTNLFGLWVIRNAVGLVRHAASVSVCAGQVASIKATSLDLPKVPG